MAFAPVEVSVVVEDVGAIVRDKQRNNLELVEVTGVPHSVVAIAGLVERMPRGVVRKPEVDRWEVVLLDPYAEDGGRELFGDDPGSECWLE